MKIGQCEAECLGCLAYTVIQDRDAYCAIRLAGFELYRAESRSVIFSRFGRDVGCLVIDRDGHIHIGRTNERNGNLASVFRDPVRRGTDSDGARGGGTQRADEEQANDMTFTREILSWFHANFVQR